MSPKRRSTTNQMFNNTMEPTITGGEFYNIGGDLAQNSYTTVASPHKTLWDTIAGVGASHNSDLQFARGSCLHGTRETVLQDIYEWSTSGSHSSPVCWLSGAAGVGKSAIALTVAKSCAKNEGLAASFFFFRSDPKRNNPSFLMLTIAHGLSTAIPPLRHIIDQKLANDPSILEATWEQQFAELVITPLLKRRWWRRVQERVLPRSIPKYPNLVIIDGLDECSDNKTQRRVLSILISAYQHSDFPLRFLICSRPESWIRDVFDDPHTSALTKRIMLNTYPSSEDIEQYFLQEFASVRKDPRYSQVKFPSPWPSHADIQRLVYNASGQFIYATTMMRFVKEDYSHPITRLRIILGDLSTQIPPKSPLVELDTLYHKIVSANSEQDKVLSILGAILLLPDHAPSSPEFIELLLELSPGEVDISLQGMHSVLDVRGPSDEIQVYHTSFTDYLYDEPRSGIFYINGAAQRDFLASQWLKVLSEHCKPPVKSFDLSTGIIFAKWADFCSSVEQPSKKLLHDLKSLDLLNLFTAASVNLPSRKEKPVPTVKLRAHWPYLALLFHSFQTVSSWLKQAGNSVDPEIIERFDNVPDHLRVQDLSDEETRSDLETWRTLNVTGCEWESSLTQRVDASVAKILNRVHSSPSMCPLSIARSTSGIGTNIQVNSFQIVKRLSDDLQTSAEFFRRSKKAGIREDRSEIGAIILNLLNSRLLECCGPKPEVFSMFCTIYEIAVEFKKDLNRSYYRLESFQQKLLSWCDSFPHDADRKELLRAQILAFFQERNESSKPFCPCQ
ncbi:hypothetical protein E1B28_010299 [Marasmius oreades]|uniref:Nephrocystin 3-like N-terminal domain-containing protein n=1 Tax=Marasmius oreades TaxID=181124 RepID=A0A9P7UTH4_9AGAR|nr:uncharacterized protein E1B28_010299 [Marasmius oreades]KAG7091249.1 hypothetical protein E1B28_010299 [Marasmius oreades]